MNKKTLGITGGALAAILLAGGGGYVALTSGSSATQLAASEVTTAAKEDLVSSVSATGSVAAERELSLSTSLTGPIESLDAKVGDRVDAQQLLGRIDTTATEQELAAQRSTQEASKLESVHQIEDAQLQLRQLQDSLDKGLNPEVNSAQSALNSAQGEYAEAQKKLDQALATKGDLPEVAEARTAVIDARSAARDAESKSFQAALASVGTAAEDPDTGVQTANAFLNFVDSDAAVADAHRKVTEAEDSYGRVLRGIDRSLGDQQRATAASYQAVADAERSLKASNLAVEQQIDAQSQAVNHAVESAASASESGAQANAPLEYSLSQAELRSPLAGVITAVSGQPGSPAEGPILTVADDSTLIVHSTVKEGDISRIEVGDEVTFTSPSSPGKHFSGKVTFISPTAEQPAKGSDEGSTGGSSKPEFPVDIRVEGNREGLRLGSTTKVKIITDRQKNAITVPLSAILEDKGTKSVLVVENGEIRSRTVRVSTESDFSAAVASGLKEGDTVITQAETFKDRVGENVEVKGA
ncbi:efflux RND transporter periplasmic adaptor subunit [Corynebacterium sp.]|uniref:efflux RND transporter periplasmic adaptor subunit n=1 Tax=Corynebacterium sp. TaxID=1720 RepID=UPI0026DB8042|nr:efflux RND transporter periplasmic adaptor subunit [Corynebacterium sp.]MDO5033118.1 efflux RND transporter periplasmic adaptor subunit [Corynebacterium sp.]